MSDFDDPTTTGRWLANAAPLPPPTPTLGGEAPFAVRAPVPPPPFTPNPPAYGFPGAPGAFQPYGAAVRPPRPKVAVGGWLLVGGGALTALGSFLTWFSVSGQDFTGFTKDDSGSVRDGPFFLIIGLVLLCLGLTLVAARRVLAIAIIAIVVGVIATWGALADIGSVNDIKTFGEVFDQKVDFGPGLYLCLVGGAIGLAGSVIAVAKRRR